jgi:flagellar assembly factor FliW
MDADRAERAPDDSDGGGPPVITFAAGLPAFPDAHRFALVSRGDPDGPFSLLQSLDDGGLAFVVTHPAPFFPDYTVDLDDDDAAAIGLDDADDALVLLIVNVAGEPHGATANLMAPVVVNRRSLLAVQAVMVDDDHSVRTPLVD